MLSHVAGLSAAIASAATDHQGTILFVLRRTYRCIVNEPVLLSAVAADERLSRLLTFVRFDELTLRGQVRSEESRPSLLLPSHSPPPHRHTYQLTYEEPTLPICARQLEIVLKASAVAGVHGQGLVWTSMLSNTASRGCALYELIPRAMAR